MNSISTMNNRPAPRRTLSSGSGGSGPSSKSNTAAPPQAATNNNNNQDTELHAIQQHEVLTAQRIQHLEQIISDTSLGVVSRTKAKVELALLQKSKNTAISEEIALINEGRGVSKNKQKIELSENERLTKEQSMQAHLESLYKVAMESREESRRKLQEQKLRTEEATAELRAAEQDAQTAMDNVKLYMEKLNVARKKVGKERKLYEEALIVEKGHVVELERLREEKEQSDALFTMKKKGSMGMEEAAEEDNIMGMEGEELMDMDTTVEDMDTTTSTTGEGDGDNDNNKTEGEEEEEEETGKLDRKLYDELNALRADLSDNRSGKTNKNASSQDDPTGEGKYWAAKCSNYHVKLPSWKYPSRNHKPSTHIKQPRYLHLKHM